MQLKKVEKILILFILVLILPALLINLGLMPLIEDESIRALVALEMDLSGDILTPTLGGELYFNKPPLFNWIILFLYNISGSYSEFIIRTPTIVFLIVFGLTIFIFTKNHLGKRFAFINALLFITCGRIMFYDSMLGLIDITFSWVIYLTFQVIYYFYKSGKYNSMFICTYILTAFGFLLKGLPSLVFTGITLLVLLISQKKVKKLFHLSHFIGVIIFILIIGSYYLLYHLKNPGTLQQVFQTLFSESSKRTVVEHSFSDSIFHFFIFPVELFYHFLPWTFLVILFFRKGAIKVIRENNYYTYCGLVFLFNILIYWFSPNVYPRYFFMMVPLIYTLFLALYKHYKSERKDIYIQIIEIVFFVVIFIAFAISLLSPFNDKTEKVPYSVLFLIFSALLYVPLLYFYIKEKHVRLIILILSILIFRTTFNLVILKIRESNAWEVACREDAEKIGKKLKTKKLKLYEDMQIDGFDEGKLLNYQSMFYITRERKKILHRDDGVDENTFYIIFDTYLKNKKFEKYYDLRIKHKKETTRVVKFLSAP